MSKICNEIQLDFCDVLIKPRKGKVSSRSLVNMTRTIKAFPYCPRTWAGVPIIAANMDTVGTVEMAKVLSTLGLSTALHKHHAIDDADFFTAITSHNAFYSMGISDADFSKYREYCDYTNSEPMQICIDVANGYMDSFEGFVRRMRSENPGALIMAGNIVDGDRAVEIIDAGADMVKVGIGSGSACLTRRVAGVGRPQLSAIIDCAEALRSHAKGGRVVSDGGCTNSGDIAKALAAGADMVMLGGMLAGHTECMGAVYETEEGPCMQFYGMSSDTAMDKYQGKTNYRASEGRSVSIPYRGSVVPTVEEILGGVRSAVTYNGSLTLESFMSSAKLYQVNRQLNQVFGK